jgi:hypothetical protein
MGLTCGYMQVSDAGSDEPLDALGRPGSKKRQGTKSLSPASLERPIACCLCDAVTAEGDLGRHGLHPGPCLKTLGHEETGLRI